ncbi:MAG: hypothetical protein D6731_21975, partial [Planctomycetota bacterium]
PTDERMRFVVDTPYYEFDGVRVEHGMQYEAMNHYDWDKKLLSEGREEPILNQPFGSVFILEVLNVLKEKRPYVDRVHPFSLYFVGALIFDTAVALRLLGLALLTFYRFRVRPILQNPRLALELDTWKAFLEYTAFPNFEHKVRKTFRQHPHLHTIILGHTHLGKIRRFGRNKTYVNTGTWTDLISLDISNLGMNRELMYATIEYFENDELPPQTRLRAWQGYRELWQDISF